MESTKKQGDLKQLFRWSIIDGLFRTGGIYTAQELRDKVNKEIINKEINNKDGGLATVEIRTIQNDLKDMEFLFGERIEIKREGHRGYRYANKRASIFNFKITDDQIESFNALLRFADGKMPEYEYNRIKSFIDDICANTNNNDLGAIKYREYIYPSKASEKVRKWIEILYQSIMQRKTVKLNYKKYGENIKSIVLSVYFMKEHNGSWYMVAWDHTGEPDKNPKVYSLDKILTLEHYSEQYIETDDKLLEEYFQYSIGIYHDLKNPPIYVELEIRNPTTIERVSANPLHRSQEIIISTKDKLLIALTVYNTIELKQTIFSLGRDIKIIKSIKLNSENNDPDFLKKEYVEYLKEIIKNN